MNARTLAAAAALLTLAGVGLVSVRSTRDQLQAIEACEAASAGDLAKALSLTEGIDGAGETARAAVDCRCRALDAQGRDDACAALLADHALRDPDWTPDPEPALRAARALGERGRSADAAALVARSRRAHPEVLALWSAEIDWRAHDEPESEVVETLANALPDAGVLAASGRALLAKRHLRRGDPTAALRVLGASPPRIGGADAELARSHWFDTKLHAHAQDDDLAGAQHTRDAWLATGSDPAVVRAHYALALSIAGLGDPDQPITDRLARALEETRDHGDRTLREGLAIRLILTLANAGRLPDALRTFDRHHEELGLEGLSRDELLRAARRETLADASPEARRGALRFAVAPRPERAQLWVSPDADAPVDAEYERRPLPDDGVLTVHRREGDSPVHWVLRREAQVLGSGTVTPRAGRERRVPIAVREATPVAALDARSRRPADGRRRVMLVLLDCGDWRIVGYLRARGELPVLGALLRDGYRAVLHSDPPLTAAALEALVWPGRRGDASLLGLVHRMGVEFAGLASVGDNPFSGLAWLLPESEDLFSRIGAGERSAANLLLAHGGIRAGRHGEVTGPHGRTSRVPIGRASRTLRPEERRRFPQLADPPNERDAHYVHTIAAEMDATAELARSGAHDLVAVRIEPLDILTHANHAAAAADGQDDGDGVLYATYRYIDTRLAEVDAALDGDDVLIVMSDHGIRTAMEHSQDAMFVATGGGVTPGRAPGRPDLRGVPRALAALLGIETGWPESGLSDFARTAVARTRATPEASVTR